MHDRLFDRTTGVENGIWQRNDTWPDRVEMTENEWLLTPLLRNIERMDPAMGKPVLVDIGPSSAGEVINFGRLLNSWGTKIVVVEADLDSMKKIEEGIIHSDVLWLNKPILYHGNGWKFGQAINAMEDDNNASPSKKS
jgi:hypothetical protein